MSVPYNPRVRHRLPSPSSQTAWSRFAALLSFLAVLSALLAPVSMLAEEVRTGKLGGICAVNSVLSSSDSADVGGVAHSAPHCQLCGSLGLAMPTLPAIAMAGTPAGQVAALRHGTVVSTAIAGLPFSRGPPCFLS